MVTANIITMRRPCPTCAEVTGRIRTAGGQDSVFCLGCGEFQYNAPRMETGRKARSLKTTHDLVGPKKRARVLARSNGLCELCGSQRDLTVADLLSVGDGHRAGLSDLGLRDDENRAAMCAECNLGLGSLSVSPRLYVALLIRRFSG